MSLGGSKAWGGYTVSTQSKNNSKLRYSNRLTSEATKARKLQKCEEADMGLIAISSFILYFPPNKTFSFSLVLENVLLWLVTIMTSGNNELFQDHYEFSYIHLFSKNSFPVWAEEKQQERMTPPPSSSICLFYNWFPTNYYFKTFSGLISPSVFSLFSTMALFLSLSHTGCGMHD